MQHVAQATDQLSSPSCWTWAVSKSLSLIEKYWRIFWKKFRRKGQQEENDKTERVTGLGRRTREEIAKWNQVTALRFQTGGRHQMSPAYLRGDYNTDTYACIETYIKSACSEPDEKRKCPAPCQHCGFVFNPCNFKHRQTQKTFKRRKKVVVFCFCF